MRYSTEGGALALCVANQVQSQHFTWSAKAHQE